MRILSTSNWLADITICPKCRRESNLEIVLDNNVCRNCSTNYGSKNNILDLVYGHRKLDLKYRYIEKRKLIEYFFNNLVTPNDGLILDLGGGKRFFKTMAPYKELLQRKKLIVTDLLPHESLDFTANVQEIPLLTNSVDFIICWSVLEHVQNPLRAIDEIKRVLKPKGKVLFYVPFAYPYHGQDYYRFTFEGMVLLLNSFDFIYIQNSRSLIDTRNHFANPLYGRFPASLWYKTVDFVFTPLVKKIMKNSWKQSSGYICIASHAKIDDFHTSHSLE